MQPLRIESTKYTLAVDFDPDTTVLRMAGASYPASALDFFEPVFQWVRSYVREVGGPIHLHLHVTYLNTSSTKCMLDLLDLLERYYRSGGEVRVEWHHAADDDDIRETGEEIAADIELPICFIVEES